MPFSLISVVQKLSLSNIYQCDEDAKENEEAALEAGNKEQGHQEHAEQGEPKVLVQLTPDHLYRVSGTAHGHLPLHYHCA